jgi:glutathione S-transferase
LTVRVMNPIRLLSGPLSMFGMKVHIALLEKALPFELTLVPYTAERGYQPKHPDVLRINPKGQVPVLIHGDVEIFDSTQIFEYLENLAPTPALWPPDIQSRATARLLEHKSDEVFFPHIIRLMQLQAELDGPVALSARDAAAAYYREMDALLQNREFLAGPYSYADIALFMAQLFAERLGAPMTGATPPARDLASANDGEACCAPRAPSVDRLPRREQPSDSDVPAVGPDRG